MVVIINKIGQEQDIEEFRKRIIIPDDKKRAIHDYVASHEQRVNNCTPTIEEDGSRWYQQSSRFKEIVDDFIMYATYVENLLGHPYVPKEDTFKQMMDYRKYLYFEGDNRSVNQSMYYFEKLVRLGLPINLSDEEKERVLKVEKEIYDSFSSFFEFLRGNNPEYRRGYSLPHSLGSLIKMLSRHGTLRLPTELDPGKKESLEKSLAEYPSSLFNNWLGCAAVRAGLNIPSLASEILEDKILLWVENDETKIRNHIRYLESFDDPKVTEIKNDWSRYLLENYISAMHHLHRLLDKNQ